MLGHEVDDTVESTGDLKAWSPFAGEADEPVLNPDGTVTARIQVDPAMAQAADARFFRLRITRKAQ